MAVTCTVLDTDASFERGPLVAMPGAAPRRHAGPGAGAVPRHAARPRALPAALAPLTPT